MSAAEFTPKQPAESYAISFNFTNDLGAHTIATASITVVDAASLDDCTSTLLDSAQQSIGSQIVYGWVRNGEAGHRYTITCRIVDSAGQSWELEGILAVTETPTAAQSMFLADLSSVFFNIDEFAESVVYTPYGGTAKAITVVLSGENPAIQDPAAPGDEMIVIAKYADITAPRKGDTFTINSETWYVTGSPQGGRSEGVWHIRVTRSARRRL